MFLLMFLTIILYEWILYILDIYPYYNDYIDSSTLKSIPTEK